MGFVSLYSIKHNTYSDVLRSREMLPLRTALYILTLYLGIQTYFLLVQYCTYLRYIEADRDTSSLCSIVV